MSDGLPMVAPNAGLVEDMTAAVGLDADEVILAVPPLRGSLTVRRLATCAVLAGCSPGHMPVVLAAAKTLASPDLNALGLLSTTGSAALMTVVNGPVRTELGFNAEANCLGPGNRSNAAVGRCLSLMTRIVGGAREGIADMATMGQPGKYTFCFAENEEASPWEPLHQDRGSASGTSAVTVVGVAGTVECYDAGLVERDSMIRALAWPLAGTNPAVTDTGALGAGAHPFVLVSPEWAVVFHREGMSKADLQVELYERSTAFAGKPILNSPAHVNVVVAGGVGIKQTVVPGWAGGSRPVTVAV